MLFSEQQRCAGCKASKSTSIPAGLLQDDAIENKINSTSKQTWIYDAKNVRDFASSLSSFYLGCHANLDVYNKERKSGVLSYYPKEGNPAV
jgi:hypothetical protein